MQNAEMKVVRFDNDDIITTSVSGYAVVSGLVNGTVEDASLTGSYDGKTIEYPNERFTNLAAYLVNIFETYDLFYREGYFENGAMPITAAFNRDVAETGDEDYSNDGFGYINGYYEWDSVNSYFKWVRETQ